MMGRFLKKTVVFCLLVILACVGLELLLLTRPNVYSYKREFMERHHDEISILLMGNSHIEEALIPELLGDSVFNFAISGKDWACDVELAQRYLPMMHHLRIVVMPFSYEYFEFGRSTDRTKGKSPLSKRREDTYKCMETKYLRVKQYGWRYWSELLYSSENYMKRLRSDQGAIDFCDSLGYVKMDAQGRPHFWQWQRLPRVFDPSIGRDEKAFERFVNGHECLAKLCCDQGARLILVSPPVYKTYQYYLNETILGEMRAVADSLDQLYHNVDYYDFFFAEGFEDGDFYDAGHLSGTGAIKFSKMLADTISLHFSFGNPEKSSYLCTDF